MTGALGTSSGTPFHQLTPVKPRRYQGSGQRFSRLMIWTGSFDPSGWARASCRTRPTISNTSVPVCA